MTDSKYFHEKLLLISVLSCKGKVILKELILSIPLLGRAIHSLETIFYHILSRVISSCFVYWDILWYKRATLEQFMSNIILKKYMGQKDQDGYNAE